MEVWLKDEKTGIECGVDADGRLFLGNDSTGYSLPDTRENRKIIIENFCKQTRHFKPIIGANGAPIKQEGKNKKLKKKR